MFVDQAEIVVRGGAGGDGCSAHMLFPLNRYPRPSGGSAGDGGDAVLLADPQLATLLDFQFKHEFRGGRGGHGGNNNRTGARGKETIVRVPVGTVIYDAEAGYVLRDLVRSGDRLVVARGGTGGLGNANAPTATGGHPGQVRRLRLELKLIADVGLIGLPNAGKSSLLSRLSTARPKIADYPFTTLTPVLGVVRVDAERVFVACDIPGLIEGAHAGKGLGIQFLRHVERTRLLVHIIDMAATEGQDPVQSFHTVNEELAAYSPVLGQRPQVIVANKMDVPDAEERLRAFRRVVDQPVVPISCATGQGVDELLRAVWTALQQLSPQAVA
jgi:GTP-binding protein